MKRNVCQRDRYVRIAVGALILLAGVLLETWWGLLGLVVLVTGLVGFCPVYRLLGLSNVSPAGQTCPSPYPDRES